MRKLWVSQLVAAAVWVGTAGAQTTVNGGRNMSGELRVSGVTATINTGASLPGTCAAGPPKVVAPSQRKRRMSSECTKESVL